ncbi:hypothetical protein [Hyphomicrobium sp. DY-1]|uniref:hypothetical protein n=1 Tax=Hyphomicrobium sp. DY-1 TaxID=3075650 RepID=UPI0039C285FC
MLKTVISSLDEVAEAVRGEYKEQKQGDKTVYVLDLEGVDAHPGVVNLKSAFERVKADKVKLTTDLAAANSKVKDLPEDFDADEWARLRTEDAARQNDPDGKDVRKQIETATASVKSQYETKIGKLTKDHATALAEKDTKIAKLEGDQRKRLITDGLTAALTESGVTSPAFLKAARAMLESGVEVIDEDGTAVAKMKAELGGDDIAKYVANWVQGDEGKSFVAPASGSGAPGSQQRSGDSNPFSKEHWSKTEQGKLLRTDRGKAERLAKSAGFRNLDAANAAARPL